MPKWTLNCKKKKKVFESRATFDIIVLLFNFESI